MSKLEQYIEQTNRWNAFASRGKYVPLSVDTLTTEQANDLICMIDCELSPENLSCDGERPISQQRTKHKFLTGVLKDIRKLGFCYVPDYY
jgi:hypothetical protein